MLSATEVASHEPGRAELLLRLDVGAAQQRRPTNKWFMVRAHGPQAKAVFE